MTTDTLTPTPVRRRDPMRTTALAGGIAYLVTFAASIPQLGLYAPVVDDPAGFVTTAGSDTGVLVGSLLEIVTAVACIATAVALYPVARRVSPTAAIGFVTSRVVEAVLIVVGALCVLTVVTLKTDAAGAAGLALTGEALVALRQWTFLVGPGVIAGVNALLLGSIMYRGRLVPRAIPIIGLAGAPLILMSAVVVLFGGWEQLSVPAGLCTLPVAAWELALGVWLTVKGFRATPVTTAR